MKDTKRYNNEDESANIAKAVQDSKNYLGEDSKTWANLVAYLKVCNTLHDVQYGCMFGGIEGYPCLALWETYGDPKKVKTDAKARAKEEKQAKQHKETK